LVSTDYEPQQKIAAFVAELKKPIPPQQVYLVNHDYFPTIRSLQFACGSEVLFSCIYAVIDDLLKSLAAESPSVERVGEIVIEIIKDYPTYKLEDIREFVMNFKKGVYGVVYGKVDILTIFTAFKKYDEARNELFEMEMYRRQHILTTKDAITLPEDQKQSPVKHIHSLYDKVVLDAQEQQKKREAEKKRETQARLAWYDKFEEEAKLAGVNLNDINSPETKKFTSDYIAKYPLNSDYIKNYKYENH